MLLFVQRAAVGRAWARQVLIQLTVAHVGLSALDWSLTPDIRKPEDDFRMALDNMDRREAPAAPPDFVTLILGVSVSALTVLGLAVPGSRTFYASMDPLAER